MGIISDEDAIKIYNTIERQISKNAADIVDIMISSKTSINVDQILEAMDKKGYKIEAKDIRQVLYDLNERGYARSMRLRNPETGWINFLWEVKPRGILQ